MSAQNKPLHTRTHSHTHLLTHLTAASSHCIGIRDVSLSPGGKFIWKGNTWFLLFFFFLAFLHSSPPLLNTQPWFCFCCPGGVNYLQDKQGDVVSVSQSQTPLSQQQRGRRVYLAGMRGWARIQKPGSSFTITGRTVIPFWRGGARRENASTPDSWAGSPRLLGCPIYLQRQWWL